MVYQKRDLIHDNLCMSSVIRLPAFGSFGTNRVVVIEMAINFIYNIKEQKHYAFIF